MFWRGNRREISIKAASRGALHFRNSVLYNFLAAQANAREYWRVVALNYKYLFCQKVALLDLGTNGSAWLKLMSYAVAAAQ